MADTVEPEPPPPPPDEVAVTQPVTPIPPDAPPPREGCLGKRSGLEKVLIVLLILIIIICLGFIAAFLVFYFFASPPEGTCLTDNCVQAASRLKSYMDESVDPCNDFYQYACGAWMGTKVLEPDETSVGPVLDIGEANKVKFKTLLESKGKPNEQEYVTKTKTFYAACMNIEKLNERGVKPFFDVLETVGKFPTLDPAWNETDFDLLDVLVELTKLGSTPLFTVDIDRDLKNPTANKIYLLDAKLALGSPTRYREGRNGTVVRHYEKWLVDNLVLLGADRKVAEDDTKDVVDLGIKIAKLMRSDEEKRDIESRYNPVTVAMLNSKYPWLKWDQFAQQLATSPTSGSVFIGVEEIVIDTEPKYMEQLGKVIEDTPPRVLANYVMSNLVSLTAALSQDFVNIHDRLNKAVRGTEPSPRWERCAGETNALFASPFGRMYVDQYFSQDALEELKSMIDDLTTAFEELLKENSWMSDETKEKAYAKLEKMSSKIGYPDNIMDDEALNALYKTIPTDKDEYMETLIAMRYYNSMKKIRTLREPKDKSTWPVSAATSNAYYDVLGNQIIFPAAFLQPPIYSPDYSRSMNYGGIGMIIGHEITHGYDDIGSRYDGSGALSSWWTEADRQNFDSRAECFVDQYGCYKWDGHSINGKLTLGENIADNGGLKQSYRAYRNFVRRKGGEEPRLPGLQLDHKQIFFLSFAQVWCGKTRDEAKKEFVETDTHSPFPQRVYGTLQNSREFAAAFQCEEGTRMNPLRKCVLW